MRGCFELNDVHETLAQIIFGIYILQDLPYDSDVDESSIRDSVQLPYYYNVNKS